MTVIPAQAGIQQGARRLGTTRFASRRTRVFSPPRSPSPWIPAFAGMTEGGGTHKGHSGTQGANLRALSPPGHGCLCLLVGHAWALGCR